jgi:hypothetical protein
MTMRKKQVDWTPTMEERSSLEGRQLKCLTASEGHRWMRGYFDRLPPVVRHRLAESDFNICPACMMIEARRAGRSKPRVNDYLALIESIEKKLTEERPQ